MQNSSGENLLRPINYNKSLIPSWEKNFRRETATILKGTHLVPEDLGREFSTHNRNFKVIGSLESTKEMLILEDGVHLWAIARWEVSKILYPEKHSEWNKTISSGPAKL